MEKTPYIVVGVQFSGSAKVYLYRLARPLIPHGLELSQLLGQRAVTTNKASYSVPTIVSAALPGMDSEVDEQDLDWIVQVIDRRPYDELHREYSEQTM